VVQPSKRCFVHVSVRFGCTVALIAVVGSVSWLAATCGAASGHASEGTTSGATVTLFGSAAPRVRTVGVRRAAELGVRFRSSQAGEIVGIRFYKTRGNRGRHTGALWSSGGRRLARVIFRRETASGWQSARFAQPVAIKTGTTYVASYHAPRGHYARNATGFRKRKVSGPLTAVGSRHAYGSGVRFPTRTDGRANYYVDVIYVSPAPPATAPLPPLGQPSCVTGAVNATTASAVTSNLARGNNVCVTADIGRVDLNGGSWSSSVVEYLGTTGSGRIGTLFVNGAIGLNIRVRAMHVGLYDAQHITLEQSRLGGENAANRSNEEAVDIRDTVDGCDDCIIRDNDIGWVHQDEETGNSGYCIRMHGNNDRMRLIRNKVHDCEADGIQGIRGDDVVIDRNEIGPVGDDPACPFGLNCDHADGIQENGRDGDVRITNNWIHHEGYYTSASGTLVSSRAASGTTYIHGGSTSPILYQNNLVETSRGRVEVCGLGTGGTSTSNTTIRNNTFYDLARAFDIQGFEWDCDSGTGNRIENNLFADNGGGFADSGRARTLSHNIIGSLSRFTFDEDRNCTSTACNPPGKAAIGYRKPTGVHW
jgi:hypothetical protein